MRRGGQNPTDVEVQDLVNKIDDGSGTLDFQDFVLVMSEKSKVQYHYFQTDLNPLGLNSFREYFLKLRHA